MQISTKPISVFVGMLYSSLKRVGLLDNVLCQRLFQEFYFLYKRHIEDPFYAVGQNYPDIFRGGIVLDLGANIGYTACVFAQLVGESGKVFAFEPDPHNFAVLQQIVARRGISDRVEPVWSAAGATQGETTLWYNKESHADHRIATESFSHARSLDASTMKRVPLVSVDYFCKTKLERKQLSFIKIDVQGYELEVCKGMTTTLKDSPGIVVALEYCPQQMRELGSDPDELLKFFTSRGFTWRLISQRGEIVEFSEKTSEEHLSKRGYLDLVAFRAEQHREFFAH